MEQLKRKLEEIIDFDMKELNLVRNEDDIKSFEDKYRLELPKDYAFYLQNYGNDYIRDDYRFVPSVELPENIKQKQFELDSIFGLNDDENNINNKIKFYRDILPSSLLPIADLPGGDLVCLGKENSKLDKIYIWFHDMEGNKILLVSNAFNDFINDFRKTKTEKNNLDNVKMNSGNKLSAFLEGASMNVK